MEEIFEQRLGHNVRTDLFVNSVCSEENETEIPTGHCKDLYSKTEKDLKRRVGKLEPPAATKETPKGPIGQLLSSLFKGSPIQLIMVWNISYQQFQE